VLRTLPNDCDHNRYGFVTSKRLGGAVVRNRVRRRLREAVRALDTRPGFDCVISAKTKAAEADFAGLRRATSSLLQRAGVLAPESEASA
jgi:ribonuclease P protein component